MPRTKVSKTSKRNQGKKLQEEKVRQYEENREDFTNRITEGTAITEGEAPKTSPPPEVPSVSQNVIEELLRTRGPLISARTRKEPPSHMDLKRHSWRYRSLVFKERGNNFAPRNPETRGTETINHGDHQSRKRTRTALPTATVTRSNAQSADMVRADIPRYNSPPPAFMRWVKPGEMVQSRQGSPIATQAFPGTCASVNIPIKDGVLSLGPETQLGDCTDILEKIEPDTLEQLKTLSTNLDKIITLAEQKKAANTAPKRE